MDGNKVVVFIAGNEEFGIPVQQVISIEKLQQVTAIPQMPEYMVGVLTIRDELVPIVDTNMILFNSQAEATDKTRIIVIKTDELAIGMIVNDAKEILDIAADQIKQLHLTAYQSSSYITGIANLNGRLITMLEPEALFQSLEGIKDIQDHIHSHQ